ncbi:PH domain-containing protein [Flavobacterium psychraquaticum]|uniref:PH domain-containing protein n=1 Tax=Flavobacterium psychraquaticum TaxID=3103958 RepID=UPI002ACE336A|nr:PH domain-containing protein [Flavobacterium sp. LB-N7T]
MLYKSEQSIFSYFIFVFLLSIFSFIAICAPSDENKGEGIWIPLTIIGLLFVFLFYSFFTTYYSILNAVLKYKCGFFKGKIDIQKIRKIEYNNSIFVPVTLKLGWSHKGLIINYNQYDDVYISPKNRDQFVAELLKSNPNIIIKE